MNEDHTTPPAGKPNADETRAIAEQWRSIADMLAYTLWEKVGVDHEACDADDCVVAFALARHAEASL